MKLIYIISVLFIQSIVCSVSDICSSDGKKVQIDEEKSDIVEFIYFSGENDLQQMIDQAAAYSTIIFDKKQQLIISNPIIVKKPLTLRGLNASLPDSLGLSAILEVESEEFVITDFFLKGNANTVSQDDRSALIKIYRSDFRIERGVFENSSKDGVMVSPLEDSNDIVGGVIRDIIGRGCVRDVVSLSGTAGGRNPKVRNILVENIRGYDSSLRGSVEVSDGTNNITVRTVYAENCRYAIDVQDHNHPVEINRNILIEDVYAKNCEWAIRTFNHRFGHSNLTLMNITADHCEKPLQLSNTDNLKVQNVYIIGHQGTIAAFSIKNCDAVTVENFSIINSTSTEEALLIKNCDQVLVDRVSLLKNTESHSSAVSYSISDEREFNSLRISNVSAPKVKVAGIVLEKTEKKARLSNYIISGNIAKIEDHIKGDNGMIINNISSEKQNSLNQQK